MTKPLLLAGVLLLASGLVACSPRAAPLPSTPAGAGDPRLDVVAGRPALISVERTDVEAMLHDGKLEGVIIGVGPVKTSLHRVGIAFDPDARDEGSPDLWLPASARWSSSELDPRSIGDTPGPLLLKIDTPTSPGGDTLALGERRYRLNWLTPAPGGVRPVLTPAQMTNLGLIARARSEGRTPTTRWRYRLLIDGLRSQVADSPAGALEPADFSDPIIEAFADQNETRWQAALSHLAEVDAVACDLLERRLACVVDFGDGALVPAWPTDHLGIDRLLSDLLDPALPDSRRVERAKTWIDTQPAGVAWVIDDAGTISADRRSMVPTIGIANFSSRPEVAWVGARASESPDLTPLPSHTARWFVVPPVPVVSDKPATTTANLGRWSQEVSLAARPVGVTPPGLSMGPFVLDLTMRGWLSDVRSTPPGAWSTGALLMRAPQAIEENPSGIRSKRWVLLAECRYEGDEKQAVADTLTIYFGAFGHPLRIVRVGRDGNVSDLTPMSEDAAELFEPVKRAEVLVERDRWTVRLELPPGAVERDGLVRIGMVRMDPLGRRSAWPRPMVPWQAEPGRAALDTRSWTGIDAEGDQK